MNREIFWPTNDVYFGIGVDLLSSQLPKIKGKDFIYIRLDESSVRDYLTYYQFSLSKKHVLIYSPRLKPLAIYLFTYKEDVVAIFESTTSVNKILKKMQKHIYCQKTSIIDSSLISHEEYQFLMQKITKGRCGDMCLSKHSLYNIKRKLVRKFQAKKIEQLYFMFINN